jgi:hypothetical protein
VITGFSVQENIRRDRDFNLAQMGDDRHTLTSLNTLLLDAAERESTNEFIMRGMILGKAVVAVFKWG